MTLKIPRKAAQISQLASLSQSSPPAAKVLLHIAGLDAISEDRIAAVLTQPLANIPFA